LLQRNAGVLNGVMKKRCHDQLYVQLFTAGSDQLRHFNQMIEVGFPHGPFAFLLRMLLRGRARGSQDALD
jgi:hypothetical protein